MPQNINKRLRHFKAFIFDLDGVLIDTEPFHFETWMQLAVENGLLYNEKIGAKMRGKTRNESLRSLLQQNEKQVDSPIFEEMILRKNELYLARINALSSHNLLPGAYLLLQHLAGADVKIGLASSSRNAHYLVEKMGIAPFFEVIVDGNDIQHSKPSPEIFLLCASKLGISPAECVVIEDSISGVAAAHHANMFCVKVGVVKDTIHADWEIESLYEILV